MRDLDTILRRHGGELEGYYAALAELFRHAPVYEDRARQELVCGAPDLCDCLLKHDGVMRPKMSFTAVLAALPLDEGERAKLAATTEAADGLLTRSILGARAAVAPDWFSWLSELARSDALERIASDHVRRIVREEPYDFAQLARAYVTEVACLVAGVRSVFACVHASPIAAVIDYMDARAEMLGDALRAAAGMRWVADEIASGAWDTSLPPALYTDLPNRMVFLITAHESTAYLIVTACRMLKDRPDAATRDIVRAAAELDFPIQSVLRQTREVIRCNGVLLPKGRRLRIHIGAAFGGAGHANRSFGVGPNTCPGARLAHAMAEAFVGAVRPLLPATRFVDNAEDRHTSRAARCFRTLSATTA